MVESTYRSEQSIDQKLRGLSSEIRLIGASDLEFSPDSLRQLIAAVTSLYSVAVSRARTEISLNDTTVNATDIVVLVCALLRSQNLNPFDLTLWFGRANPDEQEKGGPA